MIKSYNYTPFLDDGEKVVYNNYYFWKAFTPEECDRIIALGNKFDSQQGVVEGEAHNEVPEEKRMRRSKIAWIPFNNDSASVATLEISDKVFVKYFFLSLLAIKETG